MRQDTSFVEAVVSEASATIPADLLHAAGIHTGDRIVFIRTVRGSLVVLPAATDADHSLLHTVVGINPRPPHVTLDADQAYLREIRGGDGDW